MFNRKNIFLKKIIPFLKNIINKIFYTIDLVIHDSWEFTKSNLAGYENNVKKYIKFKKKARLKDFVVITAIIGFLISLFILKYFVLIYVWVFKNCYFFTKISFLFGLIQIWLFMPQDNIIEVKANAIFIKYIKFLPRISIWILAFPYIFVLSYLYFKTSESMLFEYIVYIFYKIYLPSLFFIKNAILDLLIPVILFFIKFIKYWSNNQIVVYVFLYLIYFQLFFLALMLFNNFFFKTKAIIKMYLISHFISFLVSLFFTNFYFSNEIIIFQYSKLFLLSTNAYWISFCLNKTTLFFASTVVQISFFCNLFSFYYMKNEKLALRFFFLLNFFVFSMIFFIISNNLLIMFFFWEMIGITSFFLINFYNLRPVTFKSAFKAFSFNRLSDVCLLIALILYFFSNASFEINHDIFEKFISSEIKVNFIYFSVKTVNLFLFFLSICILCKSTQLGFHYWLPDSMEAPAPASALIHSATLVSAGILIFFKFKFLFLENIFIMNIFLLIVALTSLFGSVVSFYQTDLKKILAYSTISNCGLIFCAIILSSENNFYSLFYFHGLFKSLAFLFVGFIITNNNHYQDIRQLSKSNSVNIFTLIFSLVLIQLSAWPIAHIAFFKHNILFGKTSYSFNSIIASILILSSSFSFCYSLKIIMLLFFSFKKEKKNNLIFINKYSIKILYLYFIFCMFCVTTSMFSEIFNEVNTSAFRFNYNINNIVIFLFLFTLSASYMFYSDAHNNNGFAILISLLSIIVYFNAHVF